MNTFRAKLLDTTHTEVFENATSFVGEDISGSFGLLAGHEHFVTCLIFGLARLQVEDGSWIYIALPGGVLSFVDNLLTVTARHVVTDRDYERITTILEEQLRDEEEQLRTMKHSLHSMEIELLKRLSETERLP